MGIRKSFRGLLEFQARRFRFLECPEGRMLAHRALEQVADPVGSIKQFVKMQRRRFPLRRP
jgi:hypothetical protein